MPDLVRDLFAPERWPTLVLASARVGGLFAVAPLWSLAAVPRTLRMAMTLLFAALLAAALPAAPLPAEGLDAVLPLAGEFAIGLALGLAASVIVQGVTLAGEVLALQTGLSIGAAIAPMPELQGSPFGQILGFFGVAAFVSANGHLALLRALATSFERLPAGAPVDLARGAEVIVPLAGSLFACGLQIAAPVLVTLLLVQLAMALLGRAVPQLNALMTAFPVTIGIGLVAIGFTLPLIASSLDQAIAAAPERTAQVIEALAPAPEGR